MYLAQYVIAGKPSQGVPVLSTHFGPPTRHSLSIKIAGHLTRFRVGNQKNLFKAKEKCDQQVFLFFYISHRKSFRTFGEIFPFTNCR